MIIGVCNMLIVAMFSDIYTIVSLYNMIIEDKFKYVYAWFGYPLLYW